MLGKTITLFSCLERFLLARLQPSFRQFDLFDRTFDFSLRYLNTLQSLLVRLGELDEPVADLLQEAIRFS